jgi:hypothetical protein
LLRFFRICFFICFGFCFTLLVEWKVGFLLLGLFGSFDHLLCYNSYLRNCELRWLPYDYLVCACACYTYMPHTQDIFVLCFMVVFLLCMYIFWGGGGVVFAIYVLVLAECIWGTHGCNHLVLLESF